MQKSWSEFRQMLKVANPKLVLGPTINKYGAMVFLRAPGHEDCAPGTDLIEVLAIASPAFFSFCPCESISVTEEDGKKRFVRGYNALFRKMAKMHVNNKRVINKEWLMDLYPSAFKKWDHQKFKNDLIAYNTGELTDLQKRKNWLKSRQRALPGNGMPIGWRSDMSDVQKRELVEAVEGRSSRIRDETYAMATRE